ncbi:hypothetical protein P3S67_000008 [Capsicum chacoense]
MASSCGLSADPNSFGTRHICSCSSGISPTSTCLRLGMYVVVVVVSQPIPTCCLGLGIYVVVVGSQTC